MNRASREEHQVNTMSVEASLQYFEDTVLALDSTQERLSSERQLYESESDLLSEVGYASGYTELSATSDGEQQIKQSSAGTRRRKSRQNRNQRLLCDPILGDLESDSTNDGHLFGSGGTPRVRTRTNSGQRRQRERRRQRRHNASRNSWTDSGLSLSKTDSQRSSHSEKSPAKKGQPKVFPANVVPNKDMEIMMGTKTDGTCNKKSIPNADSMVSSPELSASFPPQDTSSERKAVEEATALVDDNKSMSNQVHAGKSQATRAHEPASNERGAVFDLSSCSVSEKPVCSSSTTNSLSPKPPNDYSTLGMKPTNSQGVVNGTFSPKEKEILHQLIENERNSAKTSPSGIKLASASKFPLPPHLDYPFCMYRQNKEMKERKSGLINGLRKLKQGITNRRNSLIVKNDAEKVKIPNPNNPADRQFPPSKHIDKKKGFFRRLFKTGSTNNKKSASQPFVNFQRGKFGSSRSFTGSISQLMSRGNRARSQSVENLKNYFRREKGPHMKRSGSSFSLSGKMTRSFSVSSLVGRRNGFTRHGSMASIGGPRQSSGGFRRADSVRSLHGDIATRVLEPQNGQKQDNCFNDEYFGACHLPNAATSMNIPLRGGWRPSSRASRRDPYGYEYSPYYDDHSVVAYSDCYDDEEPCPCCCEGNYNNDGAYYNDVYEYSIDPYYDDCDIYDSRLTLSNYDNRYNNPHFTRAESVRSINIAPPRPQNLVSSIAPPRPQSHVSSYYSPANSRRPNGMVVAPLDVKVTQERRAERRQLTRASRSFDTFV